MRLTDRYSLVVASYFWLHCMFNMLFGSFVVRYIIDAGSVKFYKGGRFLREMHAGDYFGEVALLEGGNGPYHTHDDNSMRSMFEMSKFEM